MLGCTKLAGGSWWKPIEVPKEQDDADAEQPGGAGAETSHGGASTPEILSDPDRNH